MGHEARMTDGPSAPASVISVGIPPATRPWPESAAEHTLISDHSFIHSIRMQPIEEPRQVYSVLLSDDIN